LSITIIFVTILYQDIPLQNKRVFLVRIKYTML